KQLGEAGVVRAARLEGIEQARTRNLGEPFVEFARLVDQQLSELQVAPRIIRAQGKTAAEVGFRAHDVPFGTRDVCTRDQRLAARRVERERLTDEGHRTPCGLSD